MSDVIFKDFSKCLMKLGIDYLLPLRWNYINKYEVDEVDEVDEYILDYNNKIKRVNKIYIIEQVKNKLLDLNNITLNLITYINKVHDLITNDTSLIDILLDIIQDDLNNIINKGFGVEITKMTENINNINYELDNYRDKYKVLDNKYNNEKKRADDAENNIIILNDNIDNLMNELDNTNNKLLIVESDSRICYESMQKHIYNLLNELNYKASVINDLKNDVDDLTITITSIRDDLEKEYTNSDEARITFAKEKLKLNDNIKLLEKEIKVKDNNIILLEDKLKYNINKLNEANNIIYTLKSEVDEVNKYLYNEKAIRERLENDLDKANNKLNDNIIKIKYLEYNMNREINNREYITMLLNDTEEHMIVINNKLNYSLIKEKEAIERLIIIQDEFNNEKNYNLEREALAVNKAERDIINNTYNETYYLKNALIYSNDKCKALEGELDSKPELLLPTLPISNDNIPYLCQSCSKYIIYTTSSSILKQGEVHNNKKLEYKRYVNNNRVNVIDNNKVDYYNNNNRMTSAAAAGAGAAGSSSLLSTRCSNTRSSR